MSLWHYQHLLQVHTYGQIVANSPYGAAGKLRFQDSRSNLTRTARHTPYAGAATIEQGVVLDLQNMPSPGLAADLKTITVSPSRTWDQVFAELDDAGLATLGGRVGGVGVGGLTTGCKSSLEIEWYRESLRD